MLQMIAGINFGRHSSPIVYCHGNRKAGQLECWAQNSLGVKKKTVDSINLFTTFLIYSECEERTLNIIRNLNPAPLISIYPITIEYYLVLPLDFTMKNII